MGILTSVLYTFLMGLLGENCKQTELAPPPLIYGPPPLHAFPIPPPHAHQDTFFIRLQMVLVLVLGGWKVIQHIFPLTIHPPLPPLHLLI